MTDHNSQLKPSEVAALVRDLHARKAIPGWTRVMIMTPVLLGLTALTLSLSHPFLFVLCGLLTGFFYASFMILTHDAIHHTLTGNRFWDEAIPRLMSWPLLWPHGTYSAIHMIHHKMNGSNFEDPERCHLTEEEYQSAGPLRRLIARHQLLFRVLVAGGFGMIINLISQSRKIAPRSRRVRKELRKDALGIIILATAVLVPAFVFSPILGIKIVALWLIFERTVGGVQQLRAHLEHYGIWTVRPNFIESQIYNCRNIQTNSLASLFFNRLNYHSVHHAFPTIPFYHLKEAHERIRHYCHKHGVAPMIEEKGYARAALSIILEPRFVPDDLQVNGHTKSHGHASKHTEANPQKSRPQKPRPPENHQSPYC